MPISTSNSNSQALAKNFLRILQGLIFFSFNLLYSPLGNLSFLKCGNTRSPTSNYTSFLFKFVDCLYLMLLPCNYCLTFSCNDYIDVAKSSASSLLIFAFPKSLSSQMPLGCMPYTIQNGLNPMLMLGESLYENSACGSAWSHYFGCSLTKLLKIFPKLLLIALVYPSVYG